MQVSVERVVEYLRDEADRPLKAKELGRRLDVPSEEGDALQAMLDELAHDGVVYRVKGRRYAIPERLNLVVGRLQVIRSGAGFVVPDEEEAADLFVPAAAFGSAMHGDRVVARVERGRRGGRAEGRVIRVLQRARETIVGVYHPARNFGFVVPEERKLERDVFVPPGHEAEASAGDVVVVRISNWGDEHLNPSGAVERVLGPMDRPGVDVLTVVYAHALPLEFPPAVQEEAESIRRRGITGRDLEGRRDLRDAHIFTIDPADAEDHDDALSIRSLGEGRWEVGVHIADVGHYVEEGGVIDREALERGTSVYLVDRVVPMLPEALSSDLCSLRPDEDRLALSLLLTIDQNGVVRDSELVRSVIRSRHRLSYQAAQAVLDGERAIAPETDQAVARLRALSRKLRAARRKRGSIDFDLPEARVVLNTKGEPMEIERVLRLESHRMIEDFMILANETLARRAVEAEIPFLYRVHESPDAERVDRLRDLVATFGVRLSRRDEPGPKDFQRIVARFEDRRESGLVSTVVLRTMKQARYSPENLGHFGLATWNYTHFTSPIRRYPDLMVHRLAARAFIDGERIPEGLARERLPEIARHSSTRERIAVEAERDSVDLKKVEYMERHVGDEFSGTISGVTSFGFFVMIDELYVEGLVHISSLEDDYYVFLEEQYALVGEHTRRRFQLGEPVAVRVASVDREERKIDFMLVEHAD
ncbi:MAG: ribonuclease R [Gemmatimonadota bacterium]